MFFQFILIHSLCMLISIHSSSTMTLQFLSSDKYDNYLYSLLQTQLYLWLLCIFLLHAREATLLFFICKFEYFICKYNFFNNADVLLVFCFFSLPLWGLCHKIYFIYVCIYIYINSNKNHFIFNIVLVVGDLQFHFEIF